MISSHAIIRRDSSLGDGTRIGDFVIVGEWAEENPEAAPKTVLGPRARLRSHTVIYAGVQAGANFQTGHGALIREHTTIGDDVSIGSHSIVEHHVTIGHRVRIHSSAFIPEFSVLEDDCWIGPHVVLTNAPHPRCVNLPDCLRGVTIRRGAKIGANVTLLPGIIIGENALVGAGSVVSRDVPPEAVIAGPRARVIGNIHDLLCPADGESRPYG